MHAGRRSFAKRVPLRYSFLMPSPLVSIGCLLIAMTSINVGATVAKKLFLSVGPAGAAGLRIFFAAIFLVAVYRPWRQKYDAKQIRAIVIFGFALGIMNLVFYCALARLPLGIAVAIEFLGPLGVAVWGSRRGIDFLWVALAAVGVLLLVPHESGDVSAHLDPIGIAFALGAAALWAAYIIYGKRGSAIVPSGMLASVGMVAAALAVMPFSLASAGWKLFSVSALPAAITIALFSGAIPYSLELYAIRGLSAASFGILMSVEPAVAAILGLIFLSEHLRVVEWLAIACVLIASIGSSWTSHVRRRATDSLPGV